MNETLKQRFDKKWTPEPNSGCWLWIGAGDKFWIWANISKRETRASSSRIMGLISIRAHRLRFTRGDGLIIEDENKSKYRSIKSN